MSCGLSSFSTGYVYNEYAILHESKPLYAQYAQLFGIMIQRGRGVSEFVLHGQDAQYRHLALTHYNSGIAAGGIHR